MEISWFVHVYIYIYIYICIYIYVCIFIYIYIYLYFIYFYIYIFIFICMYIYIYIYIYIYTFNYLIILLFYCFMVLLFYQPHTTTPEVPKNRSQTKRATARTFQATGSKMGVNIWKLGVSRVLCFNFFPNWFQCFECLRIETDYPRTLIIFFLCLVMNFPPLHKHLFNHKICSA